MLPYITYMDPMGHEMWFIWDVGNNDGDFSWDLFWKMVIFQISWGYALRELNIAMEPWWFSIGIKLNYQGGDGTFCSVWLTRNVDFVSSWNIIEPKWSNIYIYIWVNLITTSLRPHWESWFIREIIPKWPYFRFVKYYNLPIYIYIYIYTYTLW